MTRVVIRYDIDQDEARKATRQDPGKLPPATVSGMVDCGSVVVASWDPETQSLRLGGPKVRLTLGHLKAFSVEVEP